jgi:hypothetical protein
MAIDANEALVPAASGDPQRETAPTFFAVSISKFIVLSICSIGIYDLYWFYKNWQFVRARSRQVGSLPTSCGDCRIRIG